MTEKSEDQVWVCKECNRNMEHDCDAHKTLDTHEWCQGKLLSYIPQDLFIDLAKQHRALKSDLALAVEALKQLNKDCCCVLDHSWQKELTKEALGKIKEKK